MKKSDQKVRRFLKETVSCCKIHIILLFCLQCILAALGVYYAMLLRQIFDAATKGDQREFVLHVGLFAALVVAQLLLWALIRFLDEYAASTLENVLKQRLFDNLLRRDFGQVSALHSGEWMNRLTSDTVVVAQGAVSIVPGVAGLIVRLVGALAVLLIMVPQFGLILIPGGLLMVILTYAFRKVLKKLHKNMQEKDGKVRIFLQDHLGSLMVVKAYSKEHEALEEAAALMKEHQSARMKRNMFSNVCNVGFGGVMNGAYLLGVVYGGLQIMSHAMSYGTLIAILQLIGQVQNPMANLTSYLPKYYAMLASAERLLEVELYTAEEIADIEEEAEAEDFLGVGLSAVTFAYPKKEEEQQRIALWDCSLWIKAHEMVAFTGPSGCGKSTVLKLLMALYQPTEGSVEVTFSKKRPIRVQDRRLFAYVPQGNQLMSGTIRDVVTFQDATADEAAIYEALEIACAKEFVQELPEGLSYALGERGNGLSEGQMQRIALARAIYSKRPVLLLDEATSSLDADTEYRVLENIKKKNEQTVIIVTHRPAALSFCDRSITFGDKSEIE